MSKSISIGEITEQIKESIWREAQEYFQQVTDAYKEKIEETNSNFYAREAELLAELRDKNREIEILTKAREVLEDE